MKRRYWGLVLVIAWFVSGCAGTDNPLRRFMEAPIWWQTAQADHLRLRAGELEAAGDLPQALVHWRLVRRITFGNADTVAGKEIERLEKAIADAVQAHHRNGVERLRQRDAAAARQHFLAALRLDPTYAPALRQIKARFSPFPLTVYRSRDDQTPGDVAEAAYGNRDQAYLVAWFNDLPESAAIPAGTLLMLPKSVDLPAAPRGQKQKPSPRPASLLTQAERRLAAGDLDGALTLARRAGDGPKARVLISAILVKKADAAVAAGRLDEAQAFLATVPGDAPGKKASLAALQNARDDQQRERDLERIRSHLENGRFREGLDLAEKRLAARPQDPAARDLATDARYRWALAETKAKHYLGARQILASADADHAPSMALKASVQKTLLDQAQDHYRQGVKHFINEDLKAAIASWEQALACDPGHAKARENIDNARRLLEKIEKMP